jgi:cytochrome P450
MSAAGDGTEPTYLHRCGRAFDPLSPELLAHFWETLAQMRDECPALRSDVRNGAVFVTRYDDVAATLRDWRTYTSTKGMVLVPFPNPDFKILPSETDPPLHQQFRRWLNPYFTVKAIAALEYDLRRIVIETLDSFTETGTCDLVTDFASVIPGRVIYETFYGAPPGDLPQVLEWMHAIAHVPLESVKATEEMSRWAARLLEARVAEPLGEQDVVATIGTMQFEGYELTLKERVQLLTTLIFASLDTGEVALANIGARLATSPDSQRRLRYADRETILLAVEEFLRIDPPATALARTATVDTAIAGEVVREGEQVAVYLASANRDPRRFERPDEFDLDRAENTHLAFGWGVHRCLGRQLALLELAVSLEEVVRRMPHLRVAPGREIVFRQGLNRYPHQVPVVFTPTPAERGRFADSGGLQQHGAAAPTPGGF